MQDLDGLALADFWATGRGVRHRYSDRPGVVTLAIVLLVWGFARWAIETGGDIHQHRTYNISLHENEWAKIMLDVGRSGAVFRAIHFFLEWPHTGEAAIPCTDRLAGP